jgi:hypothetical protein
LEKENIIIMTIIRLDLVGVENVEELNGLYLNEDVSSMVEALLRKALELGHATKDSPAPEDWLPLSLN